MTLKCVDLTQSSVIWIIHCNVSLNFFYFPKCLFISLVFLYIYISQGSVETRLRCNGKYNKHVSANCLQNASLKYF